MSEARLAHGVDIVVPCYNYARYLRSCVGSALGQQGGDVRVLIIDDASTDDTPRVCRELAASDARVQFRRHAQNRGHIATYNEGLLEWAAAPYSVLLSADDMLAEGALLRATELMSRSDEIGMCYGLAQVITDRDPAAGSSPPASAESCAVPGARFLKHCFENAGNPVPTPTAVVRTALQHRLGGYRADLPHTGDLEMWMRFAAHGSIGVIRSVQAYYRWHGANMSTRYYKRLLEDRRQTVLACQQIVDKWGSRFPDSPSWLDSVRRTIGMDALWSARNAFERGEADEWREWLAFAEEVCPPIRRSGVWLRLRAKRLLGYDAWRTVRPALARFLTMSAPASLRTPDTSADPTGAIQGWWPDLGAGP